MRRRVIAAPWWVRDGLDIDAEGRLRIAGRDAETLVRPARHAAVRLRPGPVRGERPAHPGGPRRHRSAVSTAVRPQSRPTTRGPRGLSRAGRAGAPESVGIDACSPGEVLRALECGWRADEVSYTGTNVSDRDLDVVLAHGVHCNLDALSQIERYGRRAPGTRVGLRIDPGTGVGYSEHLEYSGVRPMKFGIGLERFDEALAIVARHDFVVDTVHFHAGSGWLGDGLPGSSGRCWPRSKRSSGCARRATSRGGQRRRRARPAGARRRAADRLSAYAAVLARHLGPLGVTVSAEPGDYLTKDAAILLGEVVSIEDRRGVTFVGLDLGWNVNCAYFIYKFAQELVVCRAADAPRIETW